MTGRVTVTAMMCAGVLFAVAGRAERGPDLHPVREKLLLDGTPLTGKEIRFIPGPSTGGLGGGCRSDGDGAFEPIANVGEAVRPMRGAVVGWYRLTVRDGAPAEGSERPAAASSSAKPVLVPSKYGRSDSPPRVEFTPGMNDITLELRTR